MANLRTDNLYGVSGPDSNGSALFNGSDHLTAANAAAFRLNQGSTENFTMEAWIYVTGDTFMRIGRIYETSGNQRSYDLYLSSDLEIKFNYSSNGTAGGVSTLTGKVVPKNEWVHVAIAHEVSSTTLRLFLNGINVASDGAPHTTYYANTTSNFTLGEAFIGNISNFHITKSCKYTGDFTPSKDPIEEDSNTTVLCLNSRLDVLNDEKSNVFSQTTADGVKASTLMPFDRADDGVTFDGAISMNTPSYMYFPTGRTEERGRGRGLIMGYYIAPTNYNTTEFITIQSLGNSQDFGDMSQASRGHFSFGSSTRAIRGGGYVAPANVNTIEFFTIAQTGNAVDFGDITNQSHLGSYAPISNQTRGIFAGGYSYPATFNNIDYVTIASTGNSIDFGGMTTLRADGNRSQVNSSTRGLIAGGYVSPTGTDNIEYLTIATLGNSTDFGDLTQGRGNFSGLSSSTRGIFAGGTNPSNNIIDFVTIASTGNATDFGDMIDANSGAHSATSNNTRGVIVGGDQQPANYYVNTMQYVTIATTGDAQDFGDALTGKSYMGMTSDSHGGLS